MRFETTLAASTAGGAAGACAASLRAHPAANKATSSTTEKRMTSFTRNSSLGVWSTSSAPARAANIYQWGQAHGLVSATGDSPFGESVWMTPPEGRVDANCAGLPGRNRLVIRNTR